MNQSGERPLLTKRFLQRSDSVFVTSSGILDSLSVEVSDAVQVVVDHAKCSKYPTAIRHETLIQAHRNRDDIQSGYLNVRVYISMTQSVIVHIVSAIPTKPISRNILI